MIREEGGGPFYRIQKRRKSHIKPMWNSYLTKSNISATSSKVSLLPFGCTKSSAIHNAINLLAGISKSGGNKIDISSCKRTNPHVSYRGYWTKVAAGHDRTVDRSTVNHSSMVASLCESASANFTISSGKPLHLFAISSFSF